jgi:hypothetical protein
MTLIDDSDAGDKYKAGVDEMQAEILFQSHWRILLNLWREFKIISTSYTIREMQLLKQTRVLSR